MSFGYSVFLLALHRPVCVRIWMNGASTMGIADNVRDTMHASLLATLIDGPNGSELGTSVGDRTIFGANARHGNFDFAQFRAGSRHE